MEMERECTQLGTLFHSIVTDLKSSAPAWDDFVSKGTKLHNLLKSTSIAASAFIESIQKIADMATNTKGSTKDIGSALTRMCVRQKMMDNKLKHFTNALMDNLICPVHERLEDWKKAANQLEKDHTKDYKKSMHEIKKRNADTLRLKKKVRKGSKSDLQSQLSSVMRDVNERLSALEETEKLALRNLLIEERTRMCHFTNCLSPVLDLQVSMLNEVSSLQELTADAARLCRNPKQLPTSTEQLLQDFVSVANNDPSSPLQDVQINGFLSNTSSPPPSPTSSDSKTSSLCSLNSLTSSDSRSSGSLHRSSSLHHRHYQGFHPRTNSGSNAVQSSPTSCQGGSVGGPVARLSSTSSYDSGFVSTGNGTIPLNSVPLVGAEQTRKQVSKIELGDDVIDRSSSVVRLRSNSDQLPHPVAHPIGQNKHFSWKDWSRPGPYDLPPPPPPQTNGDSTRNVFPSKTAPPPITPKPTKSSHRLSADLTHGRFPPAPLYHANTTPCFFPGLPTKEENALPPPPEVDSNVASLDVHCQDDLPPPPPTLLKDENNPQTDELPPFPSSGYLPARHNSMINGNGSRYRSQENPVPQHMALTHELRSMTLGRKGSCTSLQYSTSSGYGSQHTTPACSEDTIASHDTDCGPTSCEEQSFQVDKHSYEQEKFSTLPRNYYHGNGTSQSARSNRTRRPMSTVGIPASSMIATQIDSGTATIRRKPTSKFNSVRRTNSGPKAVQTPTVPKKGLTNLMSTFAPPSQYANINGNNSTERSGDVSAFRGVEEPDLPKQNQHVTRHLSLQFQPSSGSMDDSPTPTMTMTSADYVQSYSGKMHTTSNVSSRLGGNN